MKSKYVLPLTVIALLVGVLWATRWRRRPVLPAPVAAAALEASAAAPAEAGPLVEALRSDLALHRQLVLLVADEASLKGPVREQALTEGHTLHHERRALVYQLSRALAALGAEPPAQREPVAAAVLDWLEKDTEIMEMDRLAFREPLLVLKQALASDASPQGVALAARVTADQAEVDRVEALAEAEYRQVYGGPGVPAKGGERERWKAYLDQLRPLYPAPARPAPTVAPKGAPTGEISGRELPDKVLVLSFDDGPHRVYTPELKAILQQKQVPALFFEVGRNLGALDGAGAVKLGGLSNLTEELVKAGFIIGNHSYTHAQLSKETGKPLDVEIGETDQLLAAIPGAHSHLFRFPYGARTPVQLQALQPYHLRSVLWNIDSLDWADPVPSSVADRVLRLVAEEKRGIILFHDIHDRAPKVVGGLVDQLRAQGYRFAALDTNGDLVP